MKRKVLIIGPSFFGYCQSIANGFETLGWESCVCVYDEPIHPFSLKNRLLRKLFPRNSWLKNQSRQRVNRAALEAYHRFAPDLVFVYNGDVLAVETVTTFRLRSKVAVWLLDGAYTSPRSVALARHGDAYFCFERNDLEFPALQQAPVYFLPQGFDPAIYRPLPDCSKEIDVLFVGALYGYPERIKLLKELVKGLKGRYELAFYGVYKPVYKNPVKWLFREERSVFKNRNIPPEEVNKLYNRARVCINIHHRQSKNGANPKVFEIAATGSFQIVDRNPYVETLFDERDVGLFDPNRSGDLLEKVEYALRHRLYLRSSDTLLNRTKQHTFGERVGRALSILYPQE